MKRASEMRRRRERRKTAREVRKRRTLPARQACSRFYAATEGVYTRRRAADPSGIDGMLAMFGMARR